MREEIILSTGIKGRIVYAQSETDENEEWIILVKRLEEDDDGKYKIIRHVSYDISNGVTYTDGSYDGNWGSIEGYKFYKATENQKQIIKNILKKQHKKFVKIINQVIDR